MSVTHAMGFIKPLEHGKTIIRAQKKKKKEEEEEEEEEK